MWARMRSLLSVLLHRDRVNRDIDEELRFHLATRADELVATGSTHEAARAQARRELGSIAGLKEDARQARGLRFIDESRQDLLYATRLLRRNPGFALAATAVLSLGLGIGTAAFSLIDAVMLRPLPVDHPEALRFVHSTKNGSPTLGLQSYALFTELSGAAGVFADMAGRNHDLARMRRSGAVDADLDGEAVTGNFFSVLGVKARLGRTLTPDDDRPSAPPTVVISDSLWHQRFDADPAILGARIQLAPAATGPTSEPGRAYTIVGVAPPEFSGLLQPWEPADYWVPFQIRRLDYQCTTAVGADLIGIAPFGRLRQNVSDARAREWARQMARDHRPSNYPKDWSLTVLDGQLRYLPFTPAIVPARLATAVMFVCLLVLAIAIANLTGVLLARGLARRAEIGVRLTLGAGPWRVARQLLVETSLVVAAGSAGGLALARVLLTSLTTRVPPAAWNAAPGQHVALQAPLDVRAWIFISAVSVFTTFLVATGPIRQALQTDLLTAVTSAGNAAATARGRLRSWIVVAQFAAALVLLVAASVVTRHLLRSETIDAGYRAADVSYLNTDLPAPSYCQRTKSSVAAWRDAQTTFLTGLVRRAEREPGVEAAAYAAALPWDRGFTFVVSHGTGSEISRPWWVATNTVSEDYFKTMNIDLVSGRTFDTRDSAASTPVAVICERMAQWLFPRRNPIGELVALQWPGQTQPLNWMEVIGVVKEVKPPYSEGEPNPTLYTSYLQRPGGRSYIVARSHLAAGVVVSELARTASEVDPQAVSGAGGALGEAIDEIQFPRRAAAALLSTCGTAGLGLACLGLYGVVSYSVARRMREVGIRATLGASRRNIMGLVLLEGGRVAAIGTAIGVVGAAIALRLASRFVVELPPLDFVTCLSVAGLLGAVVLLACYFPARRAARVDPIVVLRTL